MNLPNTDPTAPSKWSRSLDLLARTAALAVFSTVMVLLAELFVAATSQATLPVVDVAAVAQLIQQTQQFTQHLAMMARQILLLKEQVQSFNGHYGFGNLGGAVNGWGTSSWQDVVSMVNTGVNPGDAAQVGAYKAARAHYLREFPKLDDALETTNPRMRMTHDGDYQAAITGLSAGQSTFQTLTTHTAELQVYKNSIEKTPNVKAALDLNTAVGIKAAQINAELLRLQAFELYLQANARNAEVTGRSAEAEFFAN